MARILIIDDDRDAREMVRMVLEQAGHFVIEAENGQDGLDMLERVRPDLVLLDVQMPVMSGSVFVAELARRGEVRPFEVITMSGHVDARHAPARWFLAKPIETSLLLAVVADFCTRRQVPALAR